MELEHSFTVPVPMERAWDVLLDVERVAPCMPGATLDSVDGDEIRGKVKVKVGPINMTYAGTAHFVERDKTAGVVRLEASGKETKGAGTASASVRSVLTDHGDETQVVVKTTLNVTGKPAQFGRGVMNEVGGKLLGIFATNLAAMLAQADGGPTASEPVSDATGEAAPKADAAAGDVTLADLNLPARALASLNKEGITTIDQLTAMTGDAVLAIDGIGPASVEEIKAKLAAHDLALTGSAGPTGSAAPEADAAPASAAAAASSGPASSGAAAAGAASSGAASGSASSGPAAAESAAAGPASGPSPAAANGAAGTSKAGANGARTGATATAAPPRTASAAPVHQDEALNLLKVAGVPMLKRGLPVIAGVTAVLIIGWRRKARHRRTR